ncbi:putative Ig domain-containing protein [Aquimonas voraii]|uniref:FG-GAP repeat-containing protein n=1 Tax=Aquimonas voraii TaxID=265719 RepID=A0A1G6RR00_9GAMM|nr:putative Ig domain-containing protein [Aquimonas voraii]SDD06376.1 FG-GAP repeat-containing protein [Aquimonas voraii]
MRVLNLVWSVALIALAVGLAAEPAPADPGVGAKSYLSGVRLAPADPKRESYYGWSVSASGNRVLVGMPYEFNGVTLTTGAAYVQGFDGAQWQQEAKITPADGVNFDYFGEAVALSGDIAAVGAPDHQSARGAVYLFQRNGASWSQFAKLLPSDPLQNARFGAALSFDGTTLAAAAPNHNGGRGAVYLFTASGGTWTQSARLQAADAAANDRFGQAVAIEADTLIIGAPGKAQEVSSQGIVYVYSRNGGSWSQQARLARSGAQPGESFGSAVAVSGDLAAASAPFAAAVQGSGGGIIETYRRVGQTWSPVGSLRSAAGSASAQFGFSLALRGPRLLAGLAGDQIGDNILQGSLESYLFEEGAWTLNQRLVAVDGEQEAQIGYSVTQATDFAIGGAPGASSGAATYAGTVYAFQNRETSLSLIDLPAQAVRIGESYSVTTRVAAGTTPVPGDVLIRDDQGNSCTATLSAGAGSCSLTATVVGPRLLRARYNGAPGFAESFGSAIVQVKPDLRLQPASLPEGQIGAPYSQLFDTAATGATLPLSYSLAGGSLPPGLTLGGNGLLAGTPGAFGSFSFSVRVTDSSSAALGGPFSETRAYSLLIQPPFRTSLALDPVASPRDRGASIAFSALLNVIEDGAGAPSGTYSVSAVNGASTLSCSAPVSVEGTQSCSIDFGAIAAVGDYAITASFTSTNADFGNSSDSAPLRLLSPSDPSLSVSALDPLYLPEGSLRFRITAQNAGPDISYALRLQAAAPVGLQNLAWTCSGAACPAASGSGAPDLQIPALAAGGSLQIELSGDVSAAPPAQIEASASLVLDPAGFSRDLVDSNNSASARSLPLRLFANGFEAPEN